MTLSIQDDLLRRAREVARRQGVSLNTLIRRYLESLAGETSGEQAAEDLLKLMEERPGRSGGKRVSRDDAYEDRL
ncbi:MAG: MerR family transcriptional regulator [Deltaproteobacteria bacterium]|nr:MerR family transcriptional regulator [Deltaproteobacteria bacterium]MBW2530255.1 MerR family transcriptional regulator [Deltaproteobacteria bacterium]